MVASSTCLHSVEFLARNCLAQEKCLILKRPVYAYFRSSSRSSCSIFDIPTEILTEIILNLNVRERVAFANTSKRFHPLVFQDKQMLRNLDFSEEGRLTSVSDIDQYFRNENTSRHVLTVNLTNVTCISSYSMLESTLGKGENLIDINIQGIHLDIVTLGSFLEAFIHLKRLSIDWPKTTPDDVSLCPSALRKSFARLRYLSVRFVLRTQYSPEFSANIHVCQKLKELRIAQICPPQGDSENVWPVGHKSLENLKIFEYCGDGSIEVLNHFGFLFKNPKEWTWFAIAPDLPFKGFYFEKRIESEMLQKSKSTFANYSLSNCLLMKVITKTCEFGEHDFCCLSPTGALPCLMKIEEMKILLKNPRHKIRYLKIAHSIESYCSVHLLASIFPTLTELVLTNIIKKREGIPLNTHPKTRLQRIGEPDSDDIWNANGDSCFKMLVKNTPHLKHLTLNANVTVLPEDEKWDLEGLHLIASYKNLRSLTLKFIPIIDGEFLIEIGKQCVHLEKLELVNLGSWDCSYWEKELPQMLRHCENLQNATIRQSNVREVSKLLPFLDNNKKLRRVSIKSRSRKDTTEKLVSSIEHLLEQCPRLNTLSCIVDATAKVDITALTRDLRRLRVELSRPTLQFQVVDDGDAEDTVLEDYSPPSFPWNLDCFETAQ